MRLAIDIGGTFTDIVLEDKTNQIYEFVNFNQLKKILHKTKHLNSESKFIFSVINAAIFLKRL